MALIANESQSNNAVIDAIEIFLQSGELYFGSAPAIVSTILHSRIVITFWHPRTKIGGMCHIETARSPGGECEIHYGDGAIIEFAKLANKYNTLAGDYEVRVYIGAGIHPSKVSRDENAVTELTHLLKRYQFNIKEIDDSAAGSRKIKLDMSSGGIEKRDIAKAVTENKQTVSKQEEGNDFAMEIFLHPGDLYFGRAPTIISTLLGSCVAAALWHPKEKIGGMCHIILPEAPNGTCEMRYGDCAIKELAKQAEKYRTNPSEYQVHIYGGSDMFPDMQKSEGMRIGDRNIEKTKELLKHYKFNITEIDTGGTNSRKIKLDLSDGRVDVRKTSKPVEG